MRKTILASLLGIALLFGALVPQAEAQRWGRWSNWYGPGYSSYYYAPSYGYSYYSPGWYYSSPGYYYSSPGYYYPGTYYYSAPTYYYSAPAYYSGYWGGYYPANRGYVNTPWVTIGW